MLCQAADNDDSEIQVGTIRTFVTNIRLTSFFIFYQIYD